MYASQATISSVKQSKTNVTHLSRRNKATSASDRRPSRSLSSLQRWKADPIFTRGPTSCLIVTPCFVSTPDAKGTTWQIPDSKLLPRSISDILTQISNDFQRLLCRVQCRQTLAVAARRPVYTQAFFCFTDVFFFCFLSAIATFLSSLGSANVRHVHWALSPPDHD